MIGMWSVEKRSNGRNHCMRNNIHMGRKSKKWLNVENI
jgi:hypothetical protein